MTDKTVRCPVCGMSIQPDQFRIEYQGMRFAFCSAQCRERFQANPHLYIGRPGRPAPKQLGREIIKRRTLQLQRPLTGEQATCLINELESMMGIKRVDVEADRLRIHYDLLQATVEQIERRIEDIGDRLGHGLGDTLRRAFIHYLEETELANLEVSDKGWGHKH